MLAKYVDLFYRAEHETNFYAFHVASIQERYANL